MKDDVVTANSAANLVACAAPLKGTGSDVLAIQDWAEGNGKLLVSTRPVKKGEVFYKITGHNVVQSPTAYTIQLGKGVHIDNIGPPTFLNHSCDPNVNVDTSRLELWAAKDIQAGDPLCFFYPSTEFVMNHPFVCLCGSPRCVGVVAGAKFLSVETLGRYFVNQHIKDMIAETLSGIDH